MMSAVITIGSQLISPQFMKWILLASCSVMLFSILGLLTYTSFAKKANKNRTPHTSKFFFTLLFLCASISFIAFFILFVQSPALISPQPPLDKAMLIAPSNPLVLIFDRPIAKEISASFSPDIPGSWQFGYGQFGPLIPDRYIFTPLVPSNPNSEYQLTIENILPLGWVRLNQAQSSLLTISTPADQTNITQNSPTTPEYRIRRYTPADQETMVPLTPVINLEFDLINNHDLIAQSIAFNPPVPFETQWEGDLLRIQVTQPLVSATTYTITIQDPNSNNEPLLSWQFTTAPTTFSLNLPLYKQHHTFTCYSAASQMVLAFRDVKVGELSFLDEVGFETTPRNYVSNTWGDPQSGIVGTYNGSGAGGYGAHWQPVAKAIAKYRQVEIKENWNIPEMLEKVKAGNPVMVWWVNGVWPAKELIWNNADGLPVRGVNGMHVEVVKGWVGDQNNPTYILTNDPWRGYRQYKPEAFLNLWKWFNNTAVIVY